VVIALGVHKVNCFKVVVLVSFFSVQIACQRISVKNAYQKLKPLVGSVAAAYLVNWNF